MKVQELLMSIKNKEFKLETGLEVKKYLPIMDKKKFVTGILAECTDEVNNFITIDRFKMNIYFDMRVLSEYANIEIAGSLDEMIAEYDELSCNGVINDIIALFEDDYAALCIVLEDAIEELLVQNSIDYHVVRTANTINAFVNELGTALSKVDFESILPKNIDIAKLFGIINMLK